MNSVHFLYAALAATAVIHCSYIAILVRRYRRLDDRRKAHRGVEAAGLERRPAGFRQRRSPGPRR